MIWGFFGIFEMGWCEKLKTWEREEYPIIQLQSLVRYMTTYVDMLQLFVVHCSNLNMHTVHSKTNAVSVGR